MADTSQPDDGSLTGAQFMFGVLGGILAVGLVLLVGAWTAPPLGPGGPDVSDTLGGITENVQRHAIMFYFCVAPVAFVLGASAGPVVGSLWLRQRRRRVT
jgi:hypothetical protein